MLFRSMISPQIAEPFLTNKDGDDDVVLTNATEQTVLEKADLFYPYTISAVILLIASRRFEGVCMPLRYPFLMEFAGHKARMVLATFFRSGWGAALIDRFGRAIPRSRRLYLLCR